jgi:hypothetical protein
MAAVNGRSVAALAPPVPTAVSNARNDKASPMAQTQLAADRFLRCNLTY